MRHDAMIMTVVSESIQIVWSWNGHARVRELVFDFMMNGKNPMK